MKIAYFDCFSGVSGDMCLGALVDAGLPIGELVRTLKGLRLSGYTLRSRRVMRGGLQATKVDVIIEKRVERPQSLGKIRTLLGAAQLPETVRARALAVFERLATAEATAHRTSPGRVHFHELGGIDSLVDVVGTILGCHLLGVEDLYSSAINLGSGTVETDHGVLPVPAPATANLVKGHPVHAAGPARELTTPTGAALMTTLATGVGQLPAMTYSSIGHGAGAFTAPGWPNVLRLFIGDMAAAAESDRIVVLETNLDDMNPQLYEFLIERLLAAGALDVTLTPVIMKRGRPGILLAVLADPAKLEAVLAVMFAETTTLGVRLQEVARRLLPREITEVATKFGPVRVKIAKAPGTGRLLKIRPEYRDCKRIAEESRLPLREVLREVERALQRIS